MRHALWILAVVVAWGGRPERLSAADVDAVQVRQAIDRGIAYLRREQRSDGSWTPRTGYTGGVTSLCLLALLESGVEPDDPAIRRGLEFIRPIPPERTYVVALQTMALAQGGNAADIPLIRRNVQWLERTQLHVGDGRGAWGYPVLAGSTRVDNSNTQFALLALYEAQRVGVDVNPETWRQALQYWERTKNGRGSWGYVPGDSSSGSMTTAGISSMIIAAGGTSVDDAEADANGCRCVPRPGDETIEAALGWLGDNFRVEYNPTSSGQRIQLEQQRTYHYYYLYGMERAGRLSGRRFFVGGARSGNPVAHDWYREGAAYLVKHQNPAGFWVGEGAVETVEPITTSFALLFLSKGRRPVLISKLQRPGTDWNLLRHDLAHLTAYAEKQWKIPMTWQIIDSRTATLDDYYQTPVLFLSGNDLIHFQDPNQKQLLRAYVEEGGFIFADASCGGEAFENSFRQLMQEIFPEPQLQLKPLPPDHPIWSVEEKIDPKYVDPERRWLWGIDVGCRTSIVLSNGNLSCYWELDRPYRSEPLPEAVAEEMAACRAVGINVLAYATNRQLKPKDAIPRHLAVVDTRTTGRRGHLAVAKLRHSGGCDDAPRALSNLMEAVARSLQARVDTSAPLLDITDPSLFNYHFLFMHGRNDFRLSPAEVELLRTFVERGGIIFADSICASPAFAEAFRREMRRVLPGESLERIPINDPIFSPQFGGQDVRRVTRREAIRPRQGEPLEIKLRENVEPELEGMRHGDHYAVIFSPYDISCALERHAAPQCRGYTPEDAARIAINVLLYSLHD